MLRKMRYDGPAARLTELVEAARRVGLELDDYGIDSTVGYGWPMCGDGNAFVLAVVDDEQWSLEQIEAALRAAHEQTTGASGDWIVAAGSFVFFPDGLEPQWYDTAVRLAEALHAAERTTDHRRIRKRRAVMKRFVGAALPQAERNLAEFRSRITRAVGPDDDE